jgi:asparagine synthetase B (glutamine-hydrolysing)
MVGAMCSFLLTNVEDFDIEKANAFQRLRGPDLTNVIKLKGITFVHNLLSITGVFTPQPFVGEDIAIVFNGEIYNYRTLGDFDSDGKCLLPAYEAVGHSFVRGLDGEFAIAVVDWRNNSLLVATDVFGTKPLHYSIDGSRFGVATYASALEAIGFRSISKVPPNRYLIIDTNICRVTASASICDFSVKQYKSYFDDWLLAFKAAIKKRTDNCREKIFIGLSSGYDSGSISCELSRQGVNHKSYSIMSNEKVGIIERRVGMHLEGSEYELISPSDKEKEGAKQYLETNVESVRYNIFSTRCGYGETHRLHDDYGANGLSIICRRAKRDGRRIYISGQGSDEIFADYGFNGKAFYPHSNFGGLFPVNLESIFPWASFYESTQASYLMKEEYVAGAYGIEARYPYLDPQVVQEFLNLSHHLKNWRYKSVLRKYLDEAGYPCAFDEKFGFVP